MTNAHDILTLLTHTGGIAFALTLGTLLLAALTVR